MPTNNTPPVQSIDENGNIVIAKPDEVINSIVEDHDTTTDIIETTDPINPQPTDNLDLKEGSVVTINDVDYTIDADGSAIDAAGTIVYTKDQLTNDSIITDPITTDVNIEELNKLSDINVNLEDIEAKFTPEYIAAREKAIIEQVTTTAKTEGLNEFLSNNPDIASIVKYKSMYGTIEGYGSTVDYSEIDIAKLDAQGQLSIIIQSEINKGASKERAEKIAKLSQTDNTLLADSKEALDYLTKQQYDRVASIRKQQEDSINSYLTEYSNETGISYDNNGTAKNLNIQGSIYDDIINKGRILNFNIPQKGITITKDNTPIHLSRQELFDYVAKPVYEDNGELYSNAEVDLYEKLKNRKYRSLMALVAMNGIDSLVKAEVTKKLVINVKKQANTANNAQLGIPNNPQSGSTGTIKWD